jgi:hypothetical protein
MCDWIKSVTQFRGNSIDSFVVGPPMIKLGETVAGDVSDATIGAGAELWFGNDGRVR